MKVIAFFNSLKFWGGGEKLHLEYALEFRKLGYQVIIFAHPGSPLDYKAKENNLKVIHVNIKKLSFLNPYKINKVSNLLKSNQVDTVVFSSSQDMKFASISASIVGVRSIVYLRGLAVPVKGTFINSYLFKKCITHVVPNSIETERQLFKNIKLPIKTKVIYHGINTSLRAELNTEFINDLKKQNKGVLLGNAGRLTTQKGQSFLIDVAQKLKAMNIDFTLLIAGAGELEDELRHKILNFGLEDDVKLLGFVQDMNSFMESIDIFLLSSYWEGFGYVIVEAMNHAKPVVAFNISSNPEIVINNHTGYLVSENDLNAFVSAIKTLIESPELRKNMGRDAQNDVVSRFELKDRIKEFEAFLLS